MDITKMLVELHEERDNIGQAVLVLSRLAGGAPRRRGRPPNWLASAEPKRRGRPPGAKGMSAAAGPILTGGPFWFCGCLFQFVESTSAIDLGGLPDRHATPSDPTVTLPPGRAGRGGFASTDRCGF